MNAKLVDGRDVPSFIKIRNGKVDIYTVNENDQGLYKIKVMSCCNKT